MKRGHWKLLLCALLVLSSLVAVSIALAAPDTSGGWRLPFNDTRWISDGPSEGMHTVRSAEAIDYASGGMKFEVVAPASGTVLDLNFVFDFGCVLRINHNGLTSFFAHLGDRDDCTNSPEIFVRAGNNVVQGQRIAKTGGTGKYQSGNHLHFEARTGAVAGDVYSGWSAPTRGNPGNWWNPWYSPPPNFQHVEGLKSGGAQYPEVRVQPTTIPTPGSGRHLSSQQSPPNGPAGHMSNITDGEATVHLAGSPDTPNSAYETLFQVSEKLQSCGGCWQAPRAGTTTAPTFTEAQGPGNQSESNGQHTYQVYDYNQNNGWSTFQRYYDFWTGTSAQRIPHIVANYRAGPDTTVLEYCTSTAVSYMVYEYHGTTVDPTYSGSDCRILVHRNMTASNLYTVAAQSPDGSWSPWTIWLIVHF